MKTALNKWFTVFEACEALQMCERSVYQMCRDGEIDAIKFGASWRIPPDAIDHLVDEASTQAEERQRGGNYDPNKHLRWTEEVHRLVDLRINRAISECEGELTRHSAEIADYAGIQYRSILRCRERGWISVQGAERVARALGREPVELFDRWGDVNC